MSAPLHVVVGASGATGRVVVRELSRAGRRVRAVSRSASPGHGTEIEFVAADARQPESLHRALAGASVVYHCAMPPFARWMSDFPTITRSIVEQAGLVGARLVFADDTWMYGRVAGPISERTPENPVSNKGVLRAWLAEMLLAAHHRGTADVVIGRAPELYGPGTNSLLGANLLGAAAKRGVAIYIGNPDLPLTPLFIDDFARGLITLAEAEDASGRVWMIPTPPPTTGRDLVRMAFEHVGSRPRMLQIGTRIGRALGAVSPLAREGAEMVYQFEQPFTIDASDFSTAFGSAPTPYRDGVARTIDWYRAQRAQRHSRTLVR
ncbi:MAG TPA: NAD-dependent epimerase/dehydratase family protein [Rhodoglobus sp.]|nr:NAD-dependent epimerase/dehydratase family protein [Rhodoglobus sp.]